MHRISVACLALPLLGACGIDMGLGSDAEVKAAIGRMNAEYDHRVVTSRELIRNVRTIGRREGTDFRPVEVACLDASAASVPDILNDTVAFEREEVAQRRLADLLSGLLITADTNPRIRVDPKYRMIKATLSREEQKIEQARDTYSDAARSYNEKLHALPFNHYAGVMHYVDKPLLAMPDRGTRPPLRHDFDALRGSLRV